MVRAVRIPGAAAGAADGTAQGGGPGAREDEPGITGSERRPRGGREDRVRERTGGDVGGARGGPSGYGGSAGRRGVVTALRLSIGLALGLTLGVGRPVLAQAQAQGAGAAAAVGRERHREAAATTWARRGEAATAARAADVRETLRYVDSVRAARRAGRGGAPAATGRFPLRHAAPAPGQPGTGAAGPARVGIGTEPRGVRGQLALAAVLVDFADEQNPAGEAQTATHLFGSGRPDVYSVSQFYREASRGQLTVRGQAVGRVRLPRTSRDYVGRRAGSGGVADSLPAFLRELSTALAALPIDWAAYVDPENTPGGGGRGQVRRVTGLVVLAAGRGGECANDREHLWPHRWRLGAVLGAPILTGRSMPDGTPIVLDDYVVQGAATCDGRDLAPNGVVIHEVGHLLGLPDLYDTDTAGGGDPVGVWDLMGLGNYQTPESPALMGAWSRVALGWDEPVVIDPEARPEGVAVTLAPPAAAVAGAAGGTPDGSAAAPARVALIPMAGSEEVALLELRVPAGADQGLWPGMLVWMVAPDVVARGLPRNAVNVDPRAPGVALLQADGRDDLERAGNRGDAGDPFPGSAERTALSSRTTPAFRTRATRRPSGVALAGIRLEGTGLAARVRLTVARDGAADAGVLAVGPDTLPELYRGIPGRIAFSVDGAGAPGSGAPGSGAPGSGAPGSGAPGSGAPGSGGGPGDAASRAFRWSADSAGLARLGMTLDSLEGVLSGRPTATDTVVPLRVRVVNRTTRASGERTFAVRVAALGELRGATFVAALLDPAGAPLPAVLARFADAAGNRNGAYDLGDFVLLARRGVLAIDPGTLRQVSQELAMARARSATTAGRSGQAP